MLIRTSNLVKHYQLGEITVPAINGVTFDVREGEFVAIMGASGSGKSTLLNLIGCLDTPTSGEYFFENKLITPDSNLPKIRREKIGFVFQTFNLISQLNALQNIEVPMIYAGMQHAQRHKKALNLLHKVDLEDRAHHRPNELSGGQKQRVAIARALANEPKLIIADEPTGNLDSKTAKTIMDTLSALNKEGATIVMVTHEEEIAEYANRIIKLHDGKVI